MADEVTGDFLDPALQKVLDDADMLDASDEEEEEEEDEEYDGDEQSNSAASEEDNNTTESEEETQQAAPHLTSPSQAARRVTRAFPAGGHTSGQALEDAEDDEPIWRRTRTRLPLAHVNLDDLDGLLGDEPEDELFDEEGHEYQQFLRVLRGEADGAELADDDDDEDFVLDWDELMGAATNELYAQAPQADSVDDAPGKAGEAGQRGGRVKRSGGTRHYVYRPKSERPGHQERPLHSTLRLQARRLAPLLPTAGETAAAALAAQNPVPMAAGPPIVQLPQCLQQAPQHLRQAPHYLQQAPAQLPPGWTQAQVAQLHRLLAQHVQLLLTTFVAASSMPRREAHVGTSGAMIHALQALPSAYRPWLLLDALVEALSEATSVAGAIQAMRQLPALYSAALLPQAKVWAKPLTDTWLASEEALAGRGMLRFGANNPAKIRMYFLPMHTEEDIRNRIRKRSSQRAHDNPIKAAAARCRGPLTPLEAAQVAAGLAYYCKQPRRWELICQQFMPYRSPITLARLWAWLHPTGQQATVQPAGEGQVHWTLLSHEDHTGSHGMPINQLALPPASPQQQQPAAPLAPTAAPLTPAAPAQPVQLPEAAAGPSKAPLWQLQPAAAEAHWHPLLAPVLQRPSLAPLPTRKHRRRVPPQQRKPAAEASLPPQVPSVRPSAQAPALMQQQQQSPSPPSLPPPPQLEHQQQQQQQPASAPRAPALPSSFICPAAYSPPLERSPAAAQQPLQQSTEPASRQAPQDRQPSRKRGRSRKPSKPPSKAVRDKPPAQPPPLPTRTRPAAGKRSHPAKQRVAPAAPVPAPILARRRPVTPPRLPQQGQLAGSMCDGALLQQGPQSPDPATGPADTIPRSSAFSPYRPTSAPGSPPATQSPSPLPHDAADAAMLSPPALDAAHQDHCADLPDEPTRMPATVRTDSRGTSTAVAQQPGNGSQAGLRQDAALNAQQQAGGGFMFPAAFRAVHDAPMPCSSGTAEATVLILSCSSPPSAPAAQATALPISRAEAVAGAECRLLGFHSMDGLLQVESTMDGHMRMLGAPTQGRQQAEERDPECPSFAVARAVARSQQQQPSPSMASPGEPVQAAAAPNSGSSAQQNGTAENQMLMLDSSPPSAPAAQITAIPVSRAEAVAGAGCSLLGSHSVDGLLQVENTMDGHMRMLGSPKQGRQQAEEQGQDCLSFAIAHAIARSQQQQPSLSMAPPEEPIQAATCLNSGGSAQQNGAAEKQKSVLVRSVERGAARGQPAQKFAAGCRGSPAAHEDATQQAQLQKPTAASSRHSVATAILSAAEQMIDGVLTRWTRDEDREILHAAMKSGGVLTPGACLAVMTRLPNPAESWPLPRTERQVRARGDWLGAKLAGMARGGAQSV